MGTHPRARGAESWWGCSDSGLLIDFDSDSSSDSDSWSDTKYKINNTLIVERVCAVKARKRNVTFPTDFGFHSFGRKTFMSVLSHTSRIASASSPPKKELRLLDHLFVQIMSVRSRSITSTRCPARAGTAGHTGAVSLRRRAVRR